MAPRTPSFGLMLDLAEKPTSYAQCCSHDNARELRTLLIRREPTFLARKSRRLDLSCTPSDRLAAHLDRAEKMRLTDLCNRHSIRAPDIRSNSQAHGSRRDDRLRHDVQALAQYHSELGVRPPCDDLTPGRAAFDDAPPASAGFPTSLLVMRKRRAPRAGRATLLRRYQPHEGPVNRPLTPLIAPHFRPSKGVHRAPGPIQPPSRQRGRFP